MAEGDRIGGDAYGGSWSGWGETEDEMPAVAIGMYNVDKLNLN